MTRARRTPGRIDAHEFAAHPEPFDAAVATDADIDPFCSRSEWILSFHEAFAPRRTLHVYRADESSWIALAAQRRREIGVFFEPLEVMWGFAAPLVGLRSTEALEDLLSDPHGPLAGRPLMLSGLPITPARLEPLLSGVGSRYECRPIGTCTRYAASLDGGLDGYLSRRTPEMRRNLRSALRRCANAGIELHRIGHVAVDEIHAFHARTLAIEARSWKGRAGHGVNRGAMRTFYAHMLPRLAQRGGLRAIVAQRGGRDVGYLFGGVIGDRFRGLQFSFDDELRALSLGNALQHEMIAWLCSDGFRIYDLGSHSAYKRRWAEDGLVTASLLLRPFRSERSDDS
jgi:hypothetical protein